MKGVIHVSKKKREKRKPNYRAKDRHHILYQKRHWNRGGLKILRDYDYCVMYIPRDTLHKQIHEWVFDVPAPAEHYAYEVIRQLQEMEQRGAISDKDPIEKRLKLLIALFDCIEQPTADALRKQLHIVYEYKASL